MTKNAGGTAGRVAPRFSVVDRLEVECRENESWGHFIDTCVERFHATNSLEERSRLLARIGRVLRVELKDEAQAFDAFLEAFHLDPSNHEAVTDLTQVARATNRWQEVVEAVRGFVEAEPESWRRLLFCEQAARWCKEEMSGRDRIADVFLVEIHRIDPSHWAVRRRMASFYREQGIWDLRRTELERALLRASSHEEQRDTHYALAELYELRFNDLTRATEHYEAAFSCDPESFEVLRGLERIYTRRELYDRLRDTLERQLPLVTDLAEKHALLLRLADLWETRFVRPANAAPLLEEAMGIIPSDKETLERLERCYRAMRAWRDYVRTLERRLDLLVLREARVQALMRIGQVYASALEDPAAALDAYRRASALDPQHVEALTELARLCDANDDWRGAADCRERLAALSNAPQAQARLHLAAAALLEPANRDPERARVHYEQAVRIDTQLSGAWEGLQRLAEQEGAYEDAARFLTQRIARAEGRRAKAALYGELGLLWERAGSKEGAIKAYEEAHTLTPESTPIADHLFRLYGEARMAAKASSFCVQLLRAAVMAGDAKRAVELLNGSVAVARAHKDPSSILAQGVRVAMSFPRVREVAIAFIELCHALKDHQGAVRQGRDVINGLLKDPTGLSATTMMKVGELFWALGETERGIDALVAALAIDDGCVPALQALAEHFVALGDWERASAYRLWLARATPEAGPRFALLFDTAEALAEEALDLEQAAWVYEEARAVDPRHRLVLDRLVSIYTDLGNWERYLDVQRSLVQLDELPGLKASRLRSMALVARTRLADTRRAAELFDEVLDVDATRLDALEDISALYTDMKDWRALADVHRRVLLRAEYHARRAGPTLGPVLPLAGSTTTGSYRVARNEGSGAVPAAALERSSAGYEGDGRVRAMRERIAAGPLTGANYRELYTIFRTMHATDAAWCTASVLAHLGIADGPQKRFVGAMNAPDLAEVPGALTEADWYTNLLHSKIDRPALAAVALAAAVSQRARQYAGTEKLSRALGEPLAATGTGRGARLAKMVKDAARILHVPEPIVYERAKQQSAFAVSATTTPTLFVSFAAIDALPVGSLSFVLGRALAELHPLLVARSAFRSASEMRMLFETAARAIDPDVSVEPASAIASLRAQMNDDERHELLTAIEMTHDRPAPDFERMFHLIDVSTMRAGLLLQGIVDRAWEAMRKEHRIAFPATELRGELLSFAVSGEYFRLRDATGLTVRQVNPLPVAHRG